MQTRRDLDITITWSGIEPFDPDNIRFPPGTTFWLDKETGQFLFAERPALVVGEIGSFEVPKMPASFKWE